MNLLWCLRRNNYLINSGKSRPNNFEDFVAGTHRCQTDSSSLSYKRSKTRKLRETIIHLGEEFAGSEELGLAPKVLQKNLWGSV